MRNESSEEARTIAKPAVLIGIGLHTGRRVTLRLVPEFTGRGVRFVRVDLPGQPEVAVHQVDPAAAPFRTALKNGAAEIHTVEHVLAALSGLGISDCTLELDGLEVPGLDGSALPFAAAIREAGVQVVPTRRLKPLAVREAVVISDGDARIEARPHDGLRISYELHYPGHRLAQGSFEIELTEGAFLQEIAPARTFVLKKDAEAMRAAGFGKGADFQNTVVINGDQALETTLRFPDEPVRHKILDLLGDLYVLGRPLRAHIIAHCSGHKANRLLVARLNELESQTGSGG